MKSFIKSYIYDLYTSIDADSAAKFAIIRDIAKNTLFGYPSATCSFILFTYRFILTLN